MLTNIRDAQPTIDDWKLLMSWTTSNIPKKLNDDFDNNVHLFSTNDNVQKHNRRKLHSLWEPIACVIATKLSYYSSIDDNCVDELDIEWLISKRSRVMLTLSLWIEAGLINGALGYVEEIVYKPGSAPPQLPLYVMVKFDAYSSFPFNNEHLQIVPISIV